MSCIQKWVDSRLKKMTPQDFSKGAKHRQFRAKKNPNIIHEYYSVPLSAGCGAAILATSRNAVETDITSANLVILLHGLGYDCMSPHWHWISELTASGIAVLSIDWDGHGVGASSLLDVQEATRSIPLIMQRLYGEVNGVGLNEQRVGPRCYLMGFSFGANLALIASAREDISSLISGVIAVSPHLSIQSSFKSSFELLTFINPFNWFRDFTNKLGVYGISGLIPPYGSFRRRAFPIRQKVDIEYFEQAREFARETFEKRRILRMVKVPVLWLHGMKDKVSPYYKACQLMLEIQSAFFSYCDPERGHLRMVFSDKISRSTLLFIKNNLINYSINKEKINEKNY